jgi:Flp pilus assembly protein TadG
MRLLKNQAKRTGATAVEFAFMAPFVFLILFGILEYCRYIMVRNVTENAVREGARYALARTDTLQTGINQAGIETYIKDYINRSGSSVTGIVINVYRCNVYGQPTNSLNVVQATSTGAAAFDQTRFADYICIELTGAFRPVLPNFLLMNNITAVAASCVMCSEGN